VDEICQVAGYSKGAFYFHFSSKEEIFLELLRDHVLPSGKPAPDEPDDETGPGATREALAPLMLEFWAHAARNSRVRNDLQALYRSRIEVMSDQTAIAERDPGAVRDIARALTAIEDGLILQHILGVAHADDNLAMMKHVRRVLTQPESAPARTVSRGAVTRLRSAS
jgi:AcrR family transcriptional regulator